MTVEYDWMSDGDRTPEGQLRFSVSRKGVRASMSERVLAKLFGRKWAREQVLAAMADRIAQRISEREVLDEDEAAFFELLFSKEVRRHENLQKVCARTAQIATAPHRSLPPALEEEGDDGRAFDQRWASRFVRDAEDASDETMQDLLARILAGEIRAPGAFSFRTLSVVRDLDQGTAQRFQTVARLVVNGDMLPPHTDLTPRGGPNLAAFYQGLGVAFVDMLSLIDAGLISSTEVVLMVRPDDKDVPEFNGSLPVGAGHVINCVIGGEFEVLKLKGLRLSKPGAELLSVLEATSPASYFGLVAAWMSFSAGHNARQVFNLVDLESGVVSSILDVAKDPKKSALDILKGG